jgi:putative chitinase
MITREQLRKAMPHATSANIDRFLDPINAAMAEFEINAPARITAFLAQLAHESGSLCYVHELASGADYDTGPKAARLGNTPEDDDDGERYKGRGLIQITGTNNYRECGEALGLPLLDQPELLEQPGPACRSAAWFWHKEGLNELADVSDFLAISRKINLPPGSTRTPNGWDDRLAHWKRAKEVIV